MRARVRTGATVGRPRARDAPGPRRLRALNAGRGVVRPLTAAPPLLPTPARCSMSGDMRLILATLLALAAFPAAALAAPAVTTGDATSVGQTTATRDGHDHARRHGGAVRLRVRHDDGLRAHDGAADRPGGHGSRRRRGRAHRPLARARPTTTGSSPASVPGRGQDVHHRRGAAAALAAHDLRARLHGAHGHLGRPQGADRPEPRRHDLPRGMGLLERPRPPDAGGPLPAGDASVPLRFPLTGLHAEHAHLLAGRRHERRGHEAQHDLSASAPAAARPAITARVSDGLASWSEGVTVSGHVDGAGISGMTVALEQATFPFVVAVRRGRDRARQQQRRLPLPLPPGADRHALARRHPLHAVVHLERGRDARSARGSPPASRGSRAAPRA